MLHSSGGVGGGGGQFKARVEGNYMCSPPPGSDSWRFAQLALQNYFPPNLHSKRASLSFTLDENEFLLTLALTAHINLFSLFVDEETDSKFEQSKI